MDIKTLLADHLKIFEHFLTSSNRLIMILLNEDLHILDYNAGFKNLLSDEDFYNQHINALLLAESRNLLPLSENLMHQPFRLNFTLKHLAVFTLDCRIYKIQNRQYLILGEHIIFSNDQILNEMTALTNEMVTITRDLHRKNRELEEARSKIKTLGGIIPICSYCKQIRNDKGYWSKLETFISDHSEAEFSHSICDKCLQERYPDDEDS